MDRASADSYGWKPRGLAIVREPGLRGPPYAAPGAVRGGITRFAWPGCGAKRSPGLQTGSSGDLLTLSRLQENVACKADPCG